MNRNELFAEEYEFLDRLRQRALSLAPGEDCRSDLVEAVAAYEKLLADVTKLARVSDRQYAWLIDVRDRLRSSNEDLQRASSTDMLTGLFNRQRMDGIIRDELALRARIGPPSCLVIIDIDRFKAINDTKGHNEGDQVLARFSQVMRSRVRSTDSCARWGGDEFLLLLPNTQLDDAVRITEHIRKTAARPTLKVPRFTVSLGVAPWENGMSLEAWLSAADRCLYWAKAQGRNHTGSPDRMQVGS